MEKQKKKQAKSSGRKWDGRSRISNDTYRKRWNEIFGKRKEEDGSQIEDK